MNAAEKTALMALIRDIRDRFGIAILVIEHDMRLVMGVSERLLVLDHGVTDRGGEARGHPARPKVIEAYLGDAYLEERQIEVPGGGPRERPAHPRGEGPARLLRRDRGAPRGRSRGPRRRGRRAHRRERRREDHGAPGDLEDDPPSGGSVRFLGEDVTGLASHRLVARGMAHAPEGRRIFLNLTVGENLALGAYLRRDRDGIAKDAERAYALFPVLAERRARWPVRCPVASSRCSPSAARS